MPLNSHDFRSIYDAIGVDLNALGCVMLGVKPLPVRETLGDELSEHLFWSPDPRKFWIKGPVGQEGGHATLLYGILKSHWSGQNSEGYFDAIEAVLGDWRQPTHLLVNEILAWPDPAGGPSTTLVASLRVTPPLLDAHQRLSLLPHVDTYLEYHPHVTLAYVDSAVAYDAQLALAERFSGATIPTTDLDYGHPA